MTPSCCHTCLLCAIADKLPHKAFVFTSNVDGQFQKSGFAEAQIVECHGSIHYLQCLGSCVQDIWLARDVEPEVDEEHCRMTSELPKCPSCNCLARPNVLMFGDWDWISRRSEIQEARLQEWRKKVKRAVVIELGAGNAIPTARYFGESLDVPMIRINPREWEVPNARDVGIGIGALRGVIGISTKLAEMGF